MEVILLERIEKLGQMGDTVKVKDGFARNYLLPQRKALRATKQNLSHFEKERAQLEAANLHRREEAQQVAEKMTDITVILLRQASESAQLYGSVNARDIAQAITEAGFTVDRKQVMLDTPIKVLGIHKLRVALHPEVTVQVGVNVARSAAEAEIQAAGGAVGIDRFREEDAEVREAQAREAAEIAAEIAAEDEAEAAGAEEQPEA